MQILASNSNERLPLEATLEFVKGISIIDFCIFWELTRLVVVRMKNCDRPTIGLNPGPERLCCSHHVNPKDSPWDAVVADLFDIIPVCFADRGWQEADDVAGCMHGMTVFLDRCQDDLWCDK